MRTKPVGACLPLIALFVLGIALWVLAGGVSAAPAPYFSAPASRPASFYPPASSQIPQGLQAGGAPGAPGAPLCSPNWSVVSSPVLTNSNYLNGVAAISTNDVWAVGYNSNGTTDQTLVEHWDGTLWGVVTSPVLTNSNRLNGVAAISSSNVWAVGYYLTGIIAHTLVEQWNGTSWSVIPSPNVGANGSYLYGVAAVSATDMWAVGYSFDGTSSHALAEHWNGSTWVPVNSANVGTNNYLYGVVSVSASDVWAVGYYLNGGARTLAEHWDGSTWSSVTVPVLTSPNYFNGVAAVSAGDVWAVGSYSNGAAGQTLVERWNGTSWSPVPSPNVGTINYFNGVAAVSSNDVWAVGSYSNGLGYKTVAEHWDGISWSAVESPNVGTNSNYFNGVAAVSATDVWAVGYYNNGTVDRTLVERYNPCPPTHTPTPSPTSLSTPSSTPAATSTACTLTFTDVPVGSTFYPFIRCLACRGIINGYADGTFKPNNNVTRGQLSKIISNAAGFADTQTTQMFQDVPVRSTFQVYIGRLASRGYIGGYRCGGVGEPCIPPGNLPYFRPNNNATRGQISKIDANAAGFSDAPTGQQFEDVAAGSTYYTYTYRLVSRSIMAGYQCGGVGEPCIPPGNLPYFRPNNNATRGQTSKIVSNTFFPDCQMPARK